MPNPGSARMYTSGCPKNQNRFSHRYELPPCAASNNAVSAVRSINEHVHDAATSTGAASTISIAVTSIDHTNTGRRVQVMPGAR